MTSHHHDLDHHAPEHDDRHDRGLHHDLSVLSARRALAAATLPRRRALQLFGGAGLGLVLAACGSSSGGGSSATSAAGATAATLGSSAASEGSSGTGTGAIPEETAGPFPGDGSNGPDVLTESGVVRQDITSSFGDYSGTAEGVPLGVDLTIVSAADGSPLAGAALYLWHCDRDGGYSLYSPGVEDQNYLRGVQEADDDGALSFASIFPGAYPGRWPHMHFEVFPSLGDATSAGSRLVTSQLALPQDTCEAVYESGDGYDASVANLADLSLESDGIFSDGYDLQLPTVSGSAEAGDLRIALTIPVNA
jgi:protocatechuate 3,4-dioxygenase beta subunit